MKKIICFYEGGSFYDEATNIAKCLFGQYGLFPTIKMINRETLEFEFPDDSNDDNIMKVFVSLFEGLGGVRVNWGIFDEPISFY